MSSQGEDTGTNSGPHVNNDFTWVIDGSNAPGVALVPGIVRAGDHFCVHLPSAMLPQVCLLNS